MKSIWIIGLIGRERLFNNALILFLIIVSLVTNSCGIHSDSSSHYPYYYDSVLRKRVYEYVEKPPMYNNIKWEEGLSKEFNELFHYTFEEGEMFQTRLIVELVIDKKGEIICAKPLSNEDTPFTREAIRMLRLCDKWSPGRIGNKAVNTQLVWMVNY